MVTKTAGVDHHSVLINIFALYSTGHVSETWLGEEQL
jgi:hypothetical protein